MNNKFFLWVFASLLSISFCAFSAMADETRPEAYQQLTAVELQPGSAPRLADGFSQLSGDERRFNERLPVQLTGAIKKVKAAKYKPAKRAKQPAHHAQHAKAKA